MKTLHQIKPAFPGTYRQQLAAVAFNRYNNIRIRPLADGRLQYLESGHWYNLYESDVEYYVREAQRLGLTTSRLSKSWYRE